MFLQNAGTHLLTYNTSSQCRQLQQETYQVSYNLWEYAITAMNYRLKNLIDSKCCSSTTYSIGFYYFGKCVSLTILCTKLNTILSWNNVRSPSTEPPAATDIASADLLKRCLFTTCYKKVMLLLLLLLYLPQLPKLIHQHRILLS